VAELRELARGQSTELPDVTLQARLTGAAHGVELRALDVEGRNVDVGRVDPVTVLVGSTPEIRLVARPTSRTAFDAGMRIGLDVRLASTAVDAEQVLVPATDVGALTELEVARLEHRDGLGWRMLVPDHDGGEPRVLPDGSTATRDPLDERECPWISPGRAALRRGRGGHAPAASGEPWALVLDSSYSMRATFTESGLVALVEMVAGILAEATGRLPAVVLTTGLTRPRVVTEAVADPQVLARTVLMDPRPSSWDLATPAVREAVANGARIVAVVTDGTPADMRELVSYVDGGTARVILVVGAEGTTIDDRGDAQRLRVVEVRLTADGWESTELVRGLAGEA
jgi:hypothetical protein